MTSIPYPSFVYHRPVDKTTTTRNALIAVGRCRIDPTLFIDTTTTSNNSTAGAGAGGSGSDDAIINNNNNNKRPTSMMMMAAASSWHEEYGNVVSLAMKHANVEFDSTLDDETKKKTRKRYMKECVSAAKKYLMEKLQLDVSIIDVEIVVKAEDIIKTDGCLASCLLDAGCCRIVIEYNPTTTTITTTTTTDASGGGGGADTEKNDDIANGGVAVEENNNNTTTAANNNSSSSLSLLLDAFDCAKIPRDRLMGHLSYETYCNNNLSNSKYTMLELLKFDIEKLKPYCASCSVQVSNNNMYMNNGSSNLPPTIITANLITSIIQCDRDMEIIVQFKPSSIKGFEQEVPKMIKAVSTALRQGVNSSGVPYCNGPGFGGGHGTGCVALQDPTSTVLGLSYASCLKTDREDGLYTTVVCTRNNEALGLVYSSSDSIVAALECGRGVYYSRSRKGLWRKGDTSGHYQTLHRIDVDCDGDALRYTVTQQQPQPCGGGTGTGGGGGGNNNNNNNACGVVGNNNNNHNSTDYQPPSFCHLNTMTCWGPPRGLRNLEEVLNDRLRSAPVGSYTKRLFDDPELLKHKLVEEAQELSEAVEKQHVIEELADVLYFALTCTIKHGVCIDDACSELDRRTRKVTRRKGDSKAFRIQAAKEILSSDKKNKKNREEEEDNDNNNNDVDDDDEKKQQQS